MNIEMNNNIKVKHKNRILSNVDNNNVKYKSCEIPESLK